MPHPSPPKPGLIEIEEARDLWEQLGRPTPSKMFEHLASIGRDATIETIRRWMACDWSRERVNEDIRDRDHRLRGLRIAKGLREGRRHSRDEMLTMSDLIRETPRQLLLTTMALSKALRRQRRDMADIKQLDSAANLVIALTKATKDGLEAIMSSVNLAERAHKIPDIAEDAAEKEQEMPSASPPPEVAPDHILAEQLAILREKIKAMN